MSAFRTRSVGTFLAVALLGSALLLSCQPAQPVPSGTPKPAEKAAATPAKAQEKPVRGGTLRFANTADFNSLDPNTWTQQPPFDIIYERLIEPDVDGNLTKEGLSKDWTISADGKAITFKLREGVKFHDGTDFDAAAVKFNIERMRDPATKSPFREYYISIASVEAVDGLTVRLNLSQPDVLIVPRVAGGAGGLMVSPAGVKKYGQDFPRNPVGTGPFQFVEWSPGDHVTLKRFDGYWKKDKDGNRLPYLDRVVFKIITDETVAAANLRTGNVDFIKGVPPEQRPQVKNDPNLTYQVRGRAVIWGLHMNTKRPPFDNKALRQAVALAVDRQGLVDLQGEEGADLVASVFHPVDKAFGDGKSEVFPSRDLSKAKAKMAEAGYPTGGLKVKFTSSSGGILVREAELVKANLAEIGIEAEIEVLASAAFNTKVRNTPWDYQIARSATTNITVGEPAHYLRNMFHSQGSRNINGPYTNAQVDQALDKALGTYDLKERAALYQQAARLIVEDAPIFPAYVDNLLYGMNKKVRNYTQTWDGFERATQVWLAP